jgi:2-oxoisovalerate dehydrogenase E1 component beta subunit
LFTHVSGLKTVIPSNPRDAKGLLIAALEDENPVVFLEPKRLYNGPFDGHHDRPIVPWAKHDLSEVPDGYYTVPLGKAAIAREGRALTVLAYGTMVHVAIVAAEEQGVDAEVIDLRTLVPLDVEAIEASVKKTGRCVIVHEATRTSRLWRRVGGDRGRDLLLPSAGAVGARDRLGHTLPARAGMGLFPRPETRRPRDA